MLFLLVVDMHHFIFIFRNGVPVLNELQGSLRCPVMAFQKFSDKRPPKMNSKDSPMFLRPASVDATEEFSEGMPMSSAIVRMSFFANNWIFIVLVPATCEIDALAFQLCN